jgi:hypothetical protein
MTKANKPKQKKHKKKKKNKETQQGMKHLSGIQITNQDNNGGEIECECFHFDQLR